MAFLGGPLLTGKRSLGARLGEDLGSALQSLAQHKTQQLHSNEKAKFWTSQGVDAQTAKDLAHQPESIQKAFFDRWEAPQQQQQQSAMAQAPEQPTQPSYSPEEVNLLKSIANPVERNKVAQMMQQQRQGSQPVDSTEPSRQFGQAAAQQQVAEKVAEAQKGGLKPANYKAQEKLAQDQQLADYKEQIKLQHENKLHERKKLEESEKESKEWLKETNKKSRAVKEQNVRLDKMEKLAKSGKLTIPAVAGVLNSLEHGIFGFGINLKGLQNAESQEFEKLSNDMLSGIQDVFGSRILKTEVDTFLKTIPNLLQSDEGKLRVINNLKILNEGKLAQDKVAKQIIKENGGKVPGDLQAQVDERLDPILDNLHEKFVNQEAPKPTKSTYQKIFWE